MMGVVEDISQGCTIPLPRENKQWKVHMLGFVKDTQHHINYLPEKINKQILITMRLSISSWNELLHFVGVNLETSKLALYLITWDFDLKDFRP